MGYTRIAGRPVTTGFGHDPDPDRRVRDLGVLQAPGGHFNHYPWGGLLRILLGFYLLR